MEALRTFNFGLGWKKDKKDERDYTTEHESVAELFDVIKAVPTQRRVDLTSNLKVKGHRTLIFNQEALGSCTANSRVWGFCYLENRMNPGKYTIGSRRFLYYVTRHLIEHTTGDTGATIRDTVQAANKYGVPPEREFPYFIDEYERKPSTTVMKDALKCQASTYIRLKTWDDIINTINAGLPVDYGTTLYDNLLDSNGNIINTSNWQYPSTTNKSSIGGHALQAAGYDLDKKVIISPNSWGYDYGDDGVIYLDKKYFDRGDASDFWVVLKTNYIPSLTDRIDMMS